MSHATDSWKAWNKKALPCALWSSWRREDLLEASNFLIASHKQRFLSFSGFSFSSWSFFSLAFVVSLDQYACLPLNVFLCVSACLYVSLCVCMFLCVVLCRLLERSRCFYNFHFHCFYVWFRIRESHDSSQSTVGFFNFTIFISSIVDRVSLHDNTHNKPPSLPSYALPFHLHPSNGTVQFPGDFLHQVGLWQKTNNNPVTH